MSWNHDEAINEHIGNLAERTSFLRSVASLRKKAKIPATGFNIDIKKRQVDYFFDWRKHVPSGAVPIVNRGVTNILRRYHLSAPFKEAIRGYVIFGKNYDKELLATVSIEKTIGCALDQDSESYMLRIYPEATANRAIEFLKKNWHEIENYYMDGLYRTRQAHRFQVQIHKRPKQLRDKGIMALHDWKILKTNGAFNFKNAAEFLAEKGITIRETDDPRKGLRLLGYDLPNIDAIKKAIQRANKRRKG